MLADLDAMVKVARYVRMHPPHAPDAPLPWLACVATAANILGLYDPDDIAGTQAAALASLTRGPVSDTPQDGPIILGGPGDEDDADG